MASLEYKINVLSITNSQYRNSLINVENAVQNMASLYWCWNHAPMERRVRYMEVVEGRKAVLEMNIPVEKTRIAKQSLPTLAPNSHRTPR